MARAPFQVLVIPYSRTDAEVLFATFRRSDSDQWQFISGGGEGDEDPLSAAKREAAAGIKEGEWLRLDSIASIPRKHFPEARHWPPSLLVVPEYSFAVCISTRDVKLSDEHTDMRWLSESDSHELLAFDSNKAALRETAQRLTRL
jgi:dihydroneopterin triphosphate diphosphatase